MNHKVDLFKFAEDVEPNEIIHTKKFLHNKKRRTRKKRFDNMFQCLVCGDMIENPKVMHRIRAVWKRGGAAAICDSCKNRMEKK